jgi:RimJ/RimL family protein N-acetyltransferase
MIELKNLIFDDLPFLNEVRNECSEYLHDKRQFTLDETEKWYDSLVDPFFIVTLDGDNIGYIRTSDYTSIYPNERKPNAIVIGLDIHKDYRGLGLSKPIYLEAMNKLFIERNIDEFYLKVLSDNKRAHNLYLSLGFEELKREKYSNQVDDIYMRKYYHTIHDYDLDFYLIKLERGETFSLSRWGDGEWNCARGGRHIYCPDGVTPGHNCDRHKYFPEMSDDLRRVLKNNKPYYKGRWFNEVRQAAIVNHKIKEILTDIKIDMNWVNANVFIDALENGKISKLITQFEKMNFIMVSEPSKRDAPIKYKDYIEIPAINCYLEKERIKADMIKMTQLYDKPVFGLSASMASNVIIDELWDEIGDKCWMIDLGSIWEPLYGKVTRDYHRGLV